MQRKRRFDATETPLRCGRNAASMREKRRFDARETNPLKKYVTPWHIYLPAPQRSVTFAIWKTKTKYVAEPWTYYWSAERALWYPFRARMPG